ncbi:hypothetical protein ABT214_06780 [Micromonospora purpureochromogenes]|uniref:hypothetical protein n=1 Tax=Micromonospora purpureochromogenes TaxID=47872 RepID=UPI003326C308
MPHAGIILVSARRFPRTRGGLARLLDALDAVLATKSVPAPDSVAWLGSPE